MFHDTDAWFWESALYSWGGSVYGSDYKTLQFNTPDARKIIDVTQRLSKSGHMFNPYQFQGNWGDLAFEKFASGKAAMFFGSISGLPAMNNILKGLGMDFGVCFMPMGSKYSVVTGGGNIMMFKNATDAQKKAAAKFLEFLATDENAIGWTNITGYLPTTKTAANSSYFKNFLAQTPFYQIAVDQTETASTRPLTETWIAVQAIITEELNATLQDTNYSSQRAMQSAYDRGMVSIRNLE
jgi:sn-glycerol 3-phosphate transport system substrate-binding protein